MKFSYRPNDDEAAIAQTIAYRRNSLNRGGTNIPGGETSTEKERLIQHYRAALAEIAVSRITNLCWTGCGKGANGLLDVGDKLEVRSIASSDRGLLARRKDKDSLPCVLVLVENNRICTILGWEYFSVVKRDGHTLDAESNNPCWILEAKKLRPFEELL